MKGEALGIQERRERRKATLMEEDNRLKRREKGDGNERKAREGRKEAGLEEEPEGKRRRE